MKKRSRLLALLMALAMVLAYMPAMAFAEDGDEACEHENAYLETGYEATCIEEGCEAYWYCPDCDKYFGDTEDGMDTSVAYDDMSVFITGEDPNAHPDLEFVSGYESDCWSEGMKPYWYCTYCGQMYADANGEPDLDVPYEEEDIFTPGGHKMIHHPEEEGLFFVYGYFYTKCSEYWECENCGDLFLDEEGTEYTWYEDLYYGYTDESAETAGGIDIIAEDSRIWSQCYDIDLNIEKANDSVKAGNLVAAASYSQTAKSLAEAANRAAAALMNRARAFNALTDAYSKAAFLEYIQETVDRGAGVVRSANATANTVNKLLNAGVYVAGLPKVKISKPSTAKKSITVKWKKLTKKQLKSGVTNIEVWVATDSGFTNLVSSQIVGKKKATKKIKGLAKGTYYVKVRAIKNVGGIKYYTAWSKVKKVKVKK